MYRRSRAVGSCARLSPGSVRAPRSLRRSRACTSSRRRSRSIVPFRRAASARAWCPHWSLRSYLRPADSHRCRARAGTRRGHEKAFRCFAQARRVKPVARATQLLAALVSPVTAATLHVWPRAAVAAAPAVQGETVGLVVVVAVLALVGTWMRLVLLPAGDEGRQPVDVAIGRRVALRLARLVVGLTLLVLRERLGVARDIRLRLAGAVGRRIGGSAHRRLPVVVAVVEATTFTHPGWFILRAGEVGIVLPELLLRGGDHAVIVLGVLVVIFRRDRITRGLRVARELNIFLCNVGWISANFHVRAVRFVHPHHRVVTLAVIVASAHALVLTVSHGSPVANPFIVTARRRRAALNASTLFRTRNADVRALARSSRRQTRRRPPQCQVPCREAATPCPRHAAALPSSSSQACPRRPRISAEPMKYPIPIGRTICRVIRRPSFASSAPSALRSPAPGLAIGAQRSRVDSVNGT